MGIPKHRARRDSNETAIIRALRDIPGLSLVQVNQKGVPDILLGWQGQNYLVEIKDKGGKLTPDQVAFHETWEGSIHICKSLEDVLSVLGVTSYE